MPSAGQKRLSRRAPRHARSLKNCVCALQESPPRPLRRVPSTPARTLTSHVAVRLGSRRPVYVPGLARAGREHRSKRCATWACRRGLDRGMRPRCRQQLQRARALVPTCRDPAIGIGTRMGAFPCAFQCLLSDPNLFLNMLQIMLAIGEIHWSRRTIAASRSRRAGFGLRTSCAACLSTQKVLSTM